MKLASPLACLWIAWILTVYGPTPDCRAQGAPGDALSLDQAVSKALAHSPDLRRSRENILAAAAAIREAQALSRPRLDGASQFNLQGPIPTFTFVLPATTPGGTPQVQDVAFGRTFTKVFSITGGYDLDVAGRQRDLRASSRAEREAAAGQLLQVRNDLTYAVQTVYLSVLRARELIRVAEDGHSAAQEQLRVAEAQFRAGVSPEFDVIRARVQVANVRQGLVSAQAAERKALNTLSRLIGLEDGVTQDRSRLQLAPVVLPPEPTAVAGLTVRRLAGEYTLGAQKSPVPGDLTTALKEAAGRRPELYALEWRQRAAEAVAERESKGSRPTVRLTGSLLHQPDLAGLAVEKTTWSLVAAMSLPIWDAGLTRARAERARSAAAAANLSVTGARETVAEETRAALVDLEEAEERRVAAAANTVQAKEALRIARVRYAAGLSASVEVTDAQAALTQAQANEVNAGYDFLTALAGLNRSLGRYADDPAIARREPHPG